MKWRLILALLIFCFAVTPLFAESGLERARPTDVGMSAETLDRGIDLFVEAVGQDELRGAVLLVARHGKIVLHEAVGWRNFEENQPMKTDTLFRIASNTKPLVATAMLMLVEEGQLQIDDAICQHVPAFENEKCRDMTIRHLLSHTSGLRIKSLFLNPLMKSSSEFPDAPTLQLEVARFAEVGPEKAPGTSFSYNNAGYNTAGAIVEVCSGKLLEDFLTERIYRPLGMTDTSNHPPVEKLDRMSVVYERKPKTDETKASWKTRFRQEPRMRVPFVRASGGGVSTALDYARFCQMYLNRGTWEGKQLLSQDSVAEATAPQTQSVYSTKEQQTRESFYGLGWFVAKTGVFSHSGSEGTYAWVDPQRDVVGIVFTQSPKADIPRQEFVDLVNAACDDQ